MKTHLSINTMSLHFRHHGKVQVCAACRKMCCAECSTLVLYALEGKVKLSEYICCWTWFPND